jgi:hypothetical protein
MAYDTRHAGQGNYPAFTLRPRPERCGYRIATAPTGEPTAPVIFNGVAASMNS